jgi:hypothetical protein
VFHRVHTRRASHRLIYHLSDASCRNHYFDAQRCGDIGLNGLRDQTRLQRDLAASKMIGINAAEDDIAIGDGWRIATLPVACGAGDGTRAVRADGDAAQRVETRDRAAPGANLHHVDHRNADRNATAF